MAELGEAWMPAVGEAWSRVQVFVTAPVENAAPIEWYGATGRMLPTRVEVMYEAKPGASQWDVMALVCGPSMRKDGKRGSVTARQSWWLAGAEGGSLPDAPGWVRLFVSVNMPGKGMLP